VLALSACQGHGAATGESATNQISATDRNNGQTITLHRNDRLVVRLDSTYWTFAASPKSAVLRQVGTPHVIASPLGHGAGHCLAGMGCGTVTATYDAAGPGQVVIAADRTICGEAMRCVGSTGTYRLTVAVN
jgi:hypothetical protein